MTGLIDRGDPVDERDVRAAQAVIDAWMTTARRSLDLSGGEVLHLRGILAGTFSEVRAAGVLEGERAGWERALQAIRDELDHLT